MTRLVWFRTDLRIHDNPALTHARRDDDEATVAVISVVRNQWQRHGHGQRRINLNCRAIHALQQKLHDRGIPLLILNSGDFSGCVNTLESLLQTFAFSELNFNIEYEVNERRRDIDIARFCQQHNITVNKFHDQCLIPPGELKTQNDDPYRVYSPFRKTWLNRMLDHCPAPLSAPQPQDPNVISQNIRDHWSAHSVLPEISDDPLWEADEDSAHETLREFLDRDALHYHEWRDFPDVDGTSRLSFPLAVGLLSPRQCVYTAWQRNGCLLSGGEQGIDVWINELIWREFYRHLLVAYPDLCKHKAFKPETEGVPWRQADADFQAWCEGRTGYPVVDAAMKQLLEQGWMHNRLRMVTAMFLTKHLLIDWRRGEAFFFEHLVDADLASNNGGWQWSASTGADGAPYFRIFNPTSQSEKFDAQGNFIVRYLPELARLPKKSRHFPSPAERRMCGYPQEIVEHKSARERALRAFKQTLEA